MNAGSGQYNEIIKAMEYMRKRLKPDTALKEYWEDNERYADFFNAVLFGGREVIHASQLQERDTEESNILELGDKDESITAARDLFRVLKKKAWDGARDLHGVLNIPDEIKPFVGNYPMHLVEVVNNKLQFNNADNRDLFQLLNLVYNASLDKKSG